MKNLEVEKFKQELQSLTKEEMLQNLNKFMSNWKQPKEEAIEVTVTPKKVIEASTVAPVFFSAEKDRL